MMSWKYNPFLYLGISIASLCLFVLSGSAQNRTKLNFELQSYLKTADPNVNVPILVEGHPTALQQLVERMNGKVRLQIQNLYSLEVPAGNVKAFSESPYVDLIEFTMQPGKSMTDTMLIQAGVDSIIRSISPLNMEYSGKDVVLGVIDSGIELDHGDFKDSSGNTRILYVWDQGVAYNPLLKPGNYSYGVEWDSSSINSGTSTHDDKAVEFGHGSMVTGAAASNANATGNYRGVAPNVDIIAVATDFSKLNWLQTVAEAVDYIYKKADSLGKPCVINASVGTYRGSHDGKDIAARMIDLMIKQKSGRSFVCAAGNAGHLNFHLRHEVNNDTVFSWFETHPQLFAGVGGVYFEIWSDTADFNHMQIAFGADRVWNGNFEFRGRTNFKNLSPYVFQVTRDSIVGHSGHVLAYVDYFIEESQGRYKIEVAINDPDSSHYLFRLETAGQGNLDLWASFQLQRSAEVLTQSLPNASQFPAINKYVKTDSLQTMVSSFTCLPSVITVGNYINRNTYLDATGSLQNMGATPGQISALSSLGPNRNGYLKPDISSAGDFMMSSGRLGTINTLLQTQPSKISHDSLHMRNGGTSMASPTVAGMVALYLEMCSSSSYSQIKTDLINSARSDLFANNLPNPKWGAGKADAFQFLSQQAFSVPLNYTTGFICDLDSILLSPLGSFNQVVWNNQDTSLTLSVKNSGTYFAQATNNQGCKSVSDTVLLSFYTSPPSPSIQRSNDTLFINATGSLQWFRNQNAISGANSNFYKANLSGNYYCIITDTFSNCSSSSDTVNVTLTSLKHLKEEESIRVFPNPTKGKLTISIDQDQNIFSASILNLKGQTLKTFETSSSKQLILNLESLDNGLYFLRLYGKDETLTKMVILKK